MGSNDAEKRELIFKLMDFNSDGQIETSDLLDFINTFGPKLNKQEEEKLMELAGLGGKTSLQKEDIDMLLTKEIVLSSNKDQILSNFKVFDVLDTGMV